MKNSEERLCEGIDQSIFDGSLVIGAFVISGLVRHLACNSQQSEFCFCRKFGLQSEWPVISSYILVAYGDPAGLGEWISKDRPLTLTFAKGGVSGVIGVVSFRPRALL